MIRSVDEVDPITGTLRVKLKLCLPAIGSKLYVCSFSKAARGIEWERECGTQVNGEIVAEYEETRDIPDSRTGAWGTVRKVRWTISIEKEMNKSLEEIATTEKAELEPVRYFLYTILQKISSGLIDCLMFEKLKCGDKDITAHLFSGVPRMSVLMAECVEKLMAEKGLPDPYLITQLSARMYERRPIHGSILLLDEKDWLELKLAESKEQRHGILSLEEIKLEQRRLDIDNMRFLRKLTEMNSQEASLVLMQKNLLENEEWLVVGVIVNDYVKDKNFFWADFNGQLKWQVRRRQSAWFLYKDGYYRLQAEECMEEDYKEIIKSITGANMEKLREIIDLLKKETHGTSIVFLESKALRDEVKRFYKMNRCVKLSDEGVELQDYLKKMRGLTAIDGALLADFSGKCYAIGVILDGEIVIEGNVSRGARHNSVANYVQVAGKKYGKENVVGAVVSEDGGVKIKVCEKS